MGVPTEGGKVTITVFRSALPNAICCRGRSRLKAVFAGRDNGAQPDARNREPVDG
jgi:hypothetical protein